MFMWPCYMPISCSLTRPCSSMADDVIRFVTWPSITVNTEDTDNGHTTFLNYVRLSWPSKISFPKSHSVDTFPGRFSTTIADPTVYYGMFYPDFLVNDAIYGFFMEVNSGNLKEELNAVVTYSSRENNMEMQLKWCNWRNCTQWLN